MTDTLDRLYDTFVDLLARDESKLTVRNIAKLSGASRNTFYYHFDSIETLAAKVADGWLEGDCEQGTSLHGCVRPLLERCLEHRAEVLRLFRSHYRHVLTERAHVRLRDRLTAFLRGRLEGRLPPDETSDEILLYDHIMTGFFSHWLDKNMSYDMRRFTAPLDRDFDALYPPRS